MRYIIAPRISSGSVSLETPITENNLSMHTIFGSRDFVIALWSLASFYAVSKVVGHLTIHQDGSLTISQVAILKKLFPSARILSPDEGKKIAEPYMASFEDVKKFRNGSMWQAVKFIDVPASSVGTYTLFFDSDVLWYRSPNEIEEMIRKGKEEGAMMSNGPNPVSVALSKTDILSGDVVKYNAGIILFHTKALSWERMNNFLGRCSPYPYFTDQIGFALAIEPLSLLSEEEYLIKGKDEKFLTAKHYTGPRRGKLYLFGIPYLLATSLSHLKNKKS